MSPYIDRATHPGVRNDTHYYRTSGAFIKLCKVNITRLVSQWQDFEIFFILLWYIFTCYLNLTQSGLITIFHIISLYVHAVSSISGRQSNKINIVKSKTTVWHKNVQCSQRKITLSLWGDFINNNYPHPLFGIPRIIVNDIKMSKLYEIKVKAEKKVDSIWIYE